MGNGIRKYCEIASGVCPNGIEKIVEAEKIFTAFSSQDQKIVEQVDNAINQLNSETNLSWIKWTEDLEIENSMIFCEICKNIYQSKAIVVELSDLNFNVIFEYGYSLGINKKIHPIVNQSFDYTNIDRFFKPLLGIGIGKYQNDKLCQKLMKKNFWEKDNPDKIYTFFSSDILSDDTSITSNRLFYIKNSDNQEISGTIEKELEKYPIDVIVDDPQEENSNLLWYSKQIKKSYAAIIDLGVSGTTDNYRHFLKCAFLAGILVSTGRRLLILNSVHAKKPSDIISIVKNYSNSKEAQRHVYKFLKEYSRGFAIINSYIDTMNQRKETVFDKIDLGEYIAENDLTFLDKCFVETTDFKLLDRFGYKLIIGRKGTGKSAAFLMFKRKSKNVDNLVIHLKFNKYSLNDIYDLTESFENENDKHKIMSAFWNFILFSTVASNIVEFINTNDKYFFSNSESASSKFMVFAQSCVFLQNDKTITENLIDIIDSLRKDGSNSVKDIKTKFYEKEIVDLKKSVIQYLNNAQLKLYFNIDGIDSNLSLKTNSKIVSIILFNLHEACESLFRKTYEKYAINLFIRTDLYDSFKEFITQKDKVTKIYLKWTNQELIRLINERLQVNGINHIADLLSEEFNIQLFTEKMERYVYSRPRDYVFIFTHFIHVSRSQKRESINNKVFNDAIGYYAQHVYESIEAEILSLPFSINLSQFLSKLKHENNGKPKIPLSIMLSILNKIGLKNEDHIELLNFLLKIEFLYIYENNCPVDWPNLLNPTVKLQVLLDQSPSRTYLHFHLIIEYLITKFF